MPFHQITPEGRRLHHGGHNTITGYCIRTRLVRLITFGRWEWF